MQPGNDCAVRERKLPFPIGLHRYVVAQLCAQIVDVAIARIRIISDAILRGDYSISITANLLDDGIS